MKRWISITLLLTLSLFLQACDTILNPTDSGAEPINYESFERIFDDTKTKTLHVKITKEKWNELDTAMIDYFIRHGHYRTDYMVEADLEYTDDQGSLTIEQIGFRTRGNMSRDRIQDDEGNPVMQNFKLSFHEPYLLENEKRTVFELEELDLKWNRNWDGTYLTEKFSLDTFHAFGVFAAKTTLVKLKISIDDTTYDYGIYTAFEPIDDNFIKRRFSKEENNGNLYKSLWQNFGPANLGYPIQNRAIGIKNESINYRPSYDLKTNKVEEDHRELRSFIENINQKFSDEFHAYIEDNFEVDLFLRYLAVGVLLGNPDDYRAMGNNYYLYQNSESGKWVVIPYDYDHGMGQGWDGAPVFSNWSVGMDIYTWGNLNAHMLNFPNYQHVLVDKILNDSTYQITYETYLNQLIEGSSALFSTERFDQLYQQQSTLYGPLIEGSMMAKPFDLRNVMDYINDKKADIENQLSYYQSHPYDRGY